jgi:hypothetical protein
MQAGGRWREGMENQLDNKELAKEYAKFTLKRNWLEIEATMKLYSAKPSDDPWYGLYRETLKILKQKYKRPV